MTLARELTFPSPSVKSQGWGGLWGGGPWLRPGEKAVLAPIQTPDVNVSPNNGINIGVGGASVNQAPAIRNRSVEKQLILIENLWWWEAWKEVDLGNVRSQSHPVSKARGYPSE